MAAAPTAPTVMPAMAREESWMVGGEGGRGAGMGVILGVVEEDGDAEEEEGLSVAMELTCVGGAVVVVVEVEV